MAAANSMGRFGLMTFALSAVAAATSASPLLPAPVCERASV